MKLSLNTNILYFYNAEDGHHYTKTYGEWILYPTNVDGSLEYDSILYLEDILDTAEVCPLDFVNSCDEFLEVYNRTLQVIIMQVREGTLEID